MSTVILQVDGQRFEGWKSVNIQRGIEQLAGAFELTCADRWALQGQPLPVLKGKRCLVTIDGVTVIDGWIDGAPPRYSARGHDLIIRGRDATADLVDSCATTDGGGWVGRSLRQIAVSLAKPFGITVTVDAVAAKDADQPFLYQHLQIGETIGEALGRLARIRGVLLISDARGGLLITRAGNGRARTMLRLGDNVLEATGDDSDIERFNEYRVIGQARETDLNPGATAQQIGKSVFDNSIRRGRLLIIDPVDAADIRGCSQLAAWTRSNRRARAERVTYTVRGWIDGGRPWQPNTLVHVQDEWARFNGEYLIAAVTHTLDQRGELSSIEVVPPAAYELQPQVEIDPEAEDE